MTYFVDPYKKYYDSLSSVGDLSGNASSMVSKANDVGNMYQKISSSISSSSWNELGFQELTTSVIPNLSSAMNTLSNNLSKVLVGIASKANELLAEVSKLKTEDEKLDSYKEELNNLQSVSQYDSNGNVNSGYSAYISKKQELETKISESKTKCEEYVRNSNSIANSIKSLDGAVEDIKMKVTNASTGEQETATVVGSVEGGKMLKMKINGKEYYVPNTRLNLLDYQEYVLKVGATQNAGFLPSMCPILSQFYACDLMRGTYTEPTDAALKAQSPSTRVNATCESTNIDDVLKYIYNEAVNGRVTTLQVTQVNTKVDGSRHVVTVVGFDSSVKSWKDLNKNTILVLDCVNGRISTLAEAGTEGRDLYAMGNSRGETTYLAHGATEDFLTKEINNKQWQAKRGQGRTA